MPTYSRRIILIISDMIGLSASALLAFILTHGINLTSTDIEFPRMLMMMAISGLLAIGYFNYKGHYNWSTPWWQQVRHMIRTCSVGLVMLLLFNYVALPHVTEQGWIVLTWLFALPLTLVMRWGGRFILRAAKHWDIPTIIIGGIQNVTETVYALKSELYLSYDIQKVVIVHALGHDIEKFRETHPGLEVVESVESISPRSMVILCPDENDQTFMNDAVQQIKATGARLAVVPPTSGFSLYGLKPQFFFGHKIVLLESNPHLRSLWARFAKNTLDKVGAAIALLIFSPMFFIVAKKIKQDGGPAFYAQRRIGQGGKEFGCRKFRSMIINADQVLEGYLQQNPEARDEWAREFKLKNDPRITPVGHMIRRTSIDELPQLINVLKGEMSLVGPRPIVEAEKHFYGDKFGHYTSVKPGITGLWQASGRNDISYDQRVALDTWYVENWSLWNDIVIIFKTIYVVLARKGAY
jgi:undecaprenyl-phosphate galactose phosphotransferase